MLAAVVVVARSARWSSGSGPGTAVHDGRLVVERGVLRRSLTVVPVDRIRGVDVHASALQRVLGIVSVRVDAAATGGREDEAVLDAVSSAEGARLRDVLLREAALVEPEPVPVAPTAPVPAQPGCRRRRWCWRGSTRAGCSTHRWSAATCSPRSPRSARWPTTLDELRVPLPLRRWIEDALGTEPGVRAIVVGAVAGRARRGRRRDGHRRGGQLGVHADPPRRHAGRRARPAVPPAGVAGARPDPRVRAGRAAGAARGRRRPADRAGHRSRRRRERERVGPARPAAAARPGPASPGRSPPPR